MSIENTLNKRKQIKLFDTENVPNKKLIISLIDKTFELVPSKQSLMPYKVHVLGPEFKDLKERFFNISKTKRAVFKAKAAIQNETMQDVILKAIDRYIEN